MGRANAENPLVANSEVLIVVRVRKLPLSPIHKLDS